MEKGKKTTTLIILDGFGVREEEKYNGPKLANMPYYHGLIKEYPNTTIEASHKFVGLPDGQMGTSEVGHLNIGAGRVVKQEIVKISDSIEDGSFRNNDSINNAIKHALNNNSSVHLFGLLSDGGIHSSMEHLYALVDACKEAGVKTFIHAFLDGRDTPPKSALTFLNQLNDKIKSIENINISTLSGRYYAMDRDHRWERVEKAYEVITGFKVEQKYNSYNEAVEDQYSKDKTDEFFEPCAIKCNDSQFVKDNDSVIFYNFRSDRPREMTRAFVDEDFEGFHREQVKNLNFVTMVEYDEKIKNVNVAFAKSKPTNTLAEWLSKKGMTQFHTAETEKYAHVTFFFNGGVEKPFEGEDHIVVPSPKVATYDLKPEMSAFEVKDKVMDALKSEKYDFLVVNFANPDMVGHTGKLDAVLKALDAVDSCLKEIIEYILENDQKAIITSDHGNCDVMAYEDGSPYTAHTTNVVPFVMVDKNKPTLEENGALCDIAPTLLEMMNIDKPVEMDGKSMLKK